MLKRAILIGMAGICVANIGYSTSLKNIFHPKETAEIAIQTKGKTQSNYTNFTGKWTGHCDDANNPLTIRITNDEYTLSINNDEFNITGLNTRADSVATFSNSLTTSLNWNDDKTALIFNDVNYFHRASDLESSKASNLEVEISRGLLELKNDELIFSSTSTTYKNGISDGNGESSICRFTKK